MIRTLPFVIAVFLLAAPASAATRPVVVELFTSQGCSSCPPADIVLGELAGRSDVLALGFHVDYWNRLGWKDPFSTPGSTERQYEYAHRFGRNEVYTPQMVVDGTRQIVGSDRRAVFQAVGEARPVAAAPVDFTADGRAVAIGSGEGHGNVLLARFVQKRLTPVAAGENAGRSLEDVNGVESLAALGPWTGSPLRFDIAPPSPGEGVAVIVQDNTGRILGAAVLR